MPKIYFYKLTCDNNGAPCVHEGLLSLAICKPMIRGPAQPEDLIFGFAAKSLRRDNRLLYVARITDKVLDGGYYVQKQFAVRDDCIYRATRRPVHAAERRAPRSPRSSRRISSVTWASTPTTRGQTSS